MKYKVGDTVLVEVDEKGEIVLGQVAGPAPVKKAPKEAKEPAAAGSKGEVEGG